MNMDDSSVLKQVDCGFEHSCFLTEHGEVFSCGSGEFGQLGLGYVSYKEYRPVRVRIKELEEGDQIVQVACGAFHTCFLS